MATKNNVINEWTYCKMFDDVNKIVSKCKKCNNFIYRKHPIFSKIKENSIGCIIREIPSSKEDESGVSLSGLYMQRLSHDLKLMNVDIDDVSVLSLVKCFSRNTNRKSYTECRKYLDFELELLQPKVILCIGLNTFEKLTDCKDNFNDLRNNVYDFNGVSMITTYDLSYVIKNDSKNIEVILDYFTDINLFSRHIMKWKNTQSPSLEVNLTD